MTKTTHLASLWNRGWAELGSGPLTSEPYLSPSIFFVSDKSVPLYTVGNIIFCNPLIWVLSTLSGNPRRAHDTFKVDLQPLISVAPLGNPRSTHSAHAALVQASVARRAVVIVERGGGHELIRNSAVFHTQRSITLAYNKIHKSKNVNEKPLKKC